MSVLCFFDDVTCLSDKTYCFISCILTPKDTWIHFQGKQLCHIPFAFHFTTGQPFKGRFLGFQMYHNFANLFSKLSESTFYKETNKFQ